MSDNTRKKNAIKGEVKRQLGLDGKYDALIDGLLDLFGAATESTTKVNEEEIESIESAFDDEFNSEEFDSDEEDEDSGSGFGDGESGGGGASDDW